MLTNRRRDVCILHKVLVDPTLDDRGVQESLEVLGLDHDRLVVGGLGVVETHGLERGVDSKILDLK